MKSSGVNDCPCVYNTFAKAFFNFIPMQLLNLKACVVYPNSNRMAIVYVLLFLLNISSLQASNPSQNIAYNPDSVEFASVVKENFDLESINGFRQSQDPFHAKYTARTANPDIHLSTPELIQRYGYPTESHRVTTEDGYILTMHRIPHGKSGYRKPSGTRPVIFLQHGMFDTSAAFILNSAEKSLAYMLADRGYDVWLGNSRGNVYSQNHVSLSNKNIKFWRFSLHEMGYYDLPAEIDYILKATEKNQIYYAGQSMGNTIFFVLMSTRPEYNSKIKFMAALGPAVYLDHMKSIVKYIARIGGPIFKTFLDVIGNGVLLPRLLTKIIAILAPRLCAPEVPINKLCSEILFIIAGHDPEQTNYTQLPVVLSHVPSTVSTQTGFHYMQIIRSGKFERYDHGSTKNMRLYGSTTPPPYDLSKVVAPVALFWGENDAICDPVDVTRLAKALPNVVLNYMVKHPKFNHLDFLYAKDLDILVNIPLIKAMGNN